MKKENYETQDDKAPESESSQRQSSATCTDSESDGSRVFQRRDFLQTAVASGLLTFGIGTVHAQDDTSKEVVDQVTIDIPDSTEDGVFNSATVEQLQADTPGLESFDDRITGIKKVNSISVQELDTGSIRYVVSGNSPDFKNGLGGFTVKSGIDSASNNSPLAVEITSSPVSQETEPQDRGGAGESGSSNAPENDSSLRVLSPNSLADETDSDSGTDLTENYEGGVLARSGTNESAYLSDRARHRQTASWEASNGDVDSWDGEYCTTWVSYDSSQWNLEGNGWKDNSSSGNNWYVKSYSQLTKYDSGTLKRTQLVTDMTMKPDGTFDWWAEVTNEDPGWSTHFDFYSSYYNTSC